MTLAALLALLALSTAPASASEPAPAPGPAYADELIQAARARDLAGTTQWLRLMHYMKGWLGGQESQVAAPTFFLSPQGKSDPEAELESTIRAFFLPPPTEKNEQHAQCKYPARYLWLKTALAFDPSRLPEQPCPRFEHFKDGMRVKSASVVFSSYYLNNPSSAFGHSFIRLNKTEHSLPGDRHALLDYGVSYAAVMGNENPVVYAFKGMFGMFPGTFTSIPYYYKVREYNDFETRDLWEYDVALTPAQLQMLVAHIWELGPTFFKYWYLSQNCSYQVLTVLEAANPELTLTKRQSWVVIPVDTIKVLMTEPGFVTAVHFRPSVRTLFERRIRNLGSEQLSELHRLVTTHDPALLNPALKQEEKVAVLDAAADYVDATFSRDLLNRDSEASKWKQTFLVARSQIPVPSQEVDVSVTERDMPHLSHGSRRADFDAGYSRELGSFQRLAYRFSLHDLADPLVGYPEYAQIEMFGARFRHNALNNSLWIDDVTIFNIVSLSPLRKFNSGLSWRISLGGRTFYDRTCDYCGGANFEVGGGYSVKPVRWLPLTAFVMLEGQMAASPGFKGTHFRPGAGPAAGIRLHFTDSLIALARASYRYQGWVENPGAYEAELSARWAFHRNWGVNLRGAAYPNSVEGSLGLLFYH